MEAKTLTTKHNDGAESYAVHVMLPDGASMFIDVQTVEGANALIAAFVHAIDIQVIF